MTIETIRELMSQWDANRSKWIEARGTDDGFGDWFTKQVCTTPADEAIRRLNELTEGDPWTWDGEALGEKADDILMEFLRASGHGDVAKAFKDAELQVGFWRA